MARKAIIFDFDGTLADSLSVAVETLAFLAANYRYGTLEANDVRSLGTRQALRKAGVGFWGLPRFLSRARTEMKKRSDRILPFEGIRQMLEGLRAKGLKIYILTSNSSELTNSFLEAHGFSHLVDEVFAGSSLFGKKRALVQALKTLGFAAHEVLYVGDETRDIEACMGAGVEILPVSYGYHGPELLREVYKGKIAKSASELSLLLRELL